MPNSSENEKRKKRFASCAVTISTLVAFSILVRAMAFYIGSAFSGATKMEGVFVILAVFGAYGGLISALVERDKKFELMRVGDGPFEYHFGSVADILIGSCAAVAILLLFPMPATVNLQNLSTYARLAGYGVVAGFSGPAVLRSLRDQLPQKLGALKDKANRNANRSWISFGHVFRYQRKWKNAEWVFRDVINNDPSNTSAYIGLAQTFRDEALRVIRDIRSGTEPSREKEQKANASNLLKRAAQEIDEAIKIDPKFAPAWFTAGSVKCVQSLEILEIDQQNRQKLREDAKSNVIKALTINPGLVQFLDEEEGFDDELKREIRSQL